MEAASRRSSREAERRWKADQKAQIVADARYAVDEWREQLRDIVSLHTDPGDDVDWQSLKDMPEPLQLVRQSKNENAAQIALNNFSPKFFDFLSGGPAKRRLKLADAIIEARQADEANFENELLEYEQAYHDWQTDKEVATRLLAGDISAERDVINEMGSWGDDGLIGSRLAFAISDKHLHVVAHVHDDDIVPAFRRKQLQSGKLSETKMPIGERHELYQDYVCSVALKVAGDLFSVLPREEVFVTCVINMLDKATGHMVDTPVLSIQFVRATFNKLRLSAIDPSDSMQNFNHSMNFKRTKGFSPVEPLRPLPD